MSPIPTPRIVASPSGTNWDLIVVGSGVGGSVTAALMARRGFRVLVLEKNPVLGGILAAYSRGGIRMDMGSHLISRGNRGPLGHVLRHLGLEAPKFLRHRIPVRSRGMFPLAAPPKLYQLPQAALEATRILELPQRERLQLARMMFQVLTLTEVELRRWDRRTLDDFVRKHTDHPGAYFLFSFLASIFFVLPPWQVSAGEAIRCLRSVIESYSLSYVQGGMESLIFSLLGTVPPRGELMVHQKVVALGRRADRWRVCTTSGLELSARAVACNMAPADILGLLEPGVVPEDYAARVARIRPSGNAHQIKLLLRRPLVDEGCLIAGVSLTGLTLHDLSFELMQDTVACIDAGRIPDPMPIYAPIPSNYDPSLVSGNRQLIVASVYGPVCKDPIDPPDRWKEHVLQAFARVVPGLMDELEEVQLIPVPALGAWMGKSSRSAICNGQWPNQVGGDRLPVNTPLPGLMLCGDGAGGRGIGTELAANSAQQAAQLLTAYLSGKGEVAA